MKASLRLSRTILLHAAVFSFVAWSVYFPQSPLSDIERANAANVSYVNAGTLGAAADAGADPTAALPANTQTNDILIIHAWTRNTSDTTTITEFTEFAQVDTTTGSHRWFWKRHDGSEGTATCNRSGTTGDSYCQMFAFRNVATTGNPWNALGTAEADAAANSYTITAITTGEASSMVVVFSGYEDNDTASVIMTGTDPAAYTEVYNESGTGADGAIAIGYELRTTAGSTGTITVDYNLNPTTDQTGSLVLSLAPEPVTLSGSAYESGGSTILADCDGSQKNISLTVATSTPGNFYTTCSALTGAFSFTLIGTIAADTIMTLFIDGETSVGTTVLKYSGSGNATKANVRKNHLILRNDSTGSLTNVNLGGFDSDGGTEDTGDTDIVFTSNSNNLSVESGIKVLLNTGDTYDPGGTVTTTGSGGDFEVATSSTAYLDTSSNTIAGDIIVSNNPSTCSCGGAMYIDANTTVNGGDITATGTANVLYSGGQTPTLTISGTGLVTDGSGSNSTSTFYNLTTSGSGTTTFGTDLILGNDLTVGSGTTLQNNGPNSMTVKGGDATGDGTISLIGGTFTLTGTGYLGGSSNWTLASSTIGTGTTASTTASGTGSITATSTLTIGAGSYFFGAGKNISLVDNSSPFVVSGDFEPGTSTLSYQSTANVSVTATSTYNLTINGTGNFTASANLTVNNALTVTSGNLILGNNNLTVGLSSVANSGSIKVAQGQTLNQSSGGTTTILGSASGANCIGSDGASCAGTAGTLVFGSLTIGNGGTAFTTTFGANAGTPSTTVDNILRLRDNAALDAGSTTFNIKNSDVSFLRTGAFTANSSHFIYSGANPTVATTTFYNLSLTPTGTATYILPSGTIAVNNDLVLGDGTNALTLDANTNDPALDVNRDLTISANTAFQASNSGALTIARDFTNSGTFTHGSGTVTLDGPGNSSIIGATTFHNFTSTTAGKQIKFQTSVIFTFNGAFTITGTGAANGQVTLRPTIGSGQWLAHFNNAQTTVDYADIRNAGCDAGTANVSLGSSNIDRGGNGTCWVFPILSGGPGLSDGVPGGGNAQGGGGRGGGSGGSDGGSGGGGGQSGGGSGGGGGAVE